MPAFVGFGLSTVLTSFGQQATPTPIPFTVVASKTVPEGNHTVTYNRVLPPSLPVSTPVPANPTPMSAQALQQLQALSPPQPAISETVMIFATVFNHQLTQLSWSSGGVNYQAYSNIDFHIFPGMVAVTTTDANYMLILAVADADAKKFPAATNSGGAPQTPSIPSLPALTPAQSAFVPVSANGAAPPDVALAPIYALHDYFDANRAEILAAHSSAVHEAWLNKNQPPATPQNTVINFWKAPGQNSGNSSNP